MWKRIAKGLLGLVCLGGAGMLAAACGSSAETGLYDLNYTTKCDEWPVAICTEDVDCYSGLVFEPGTRCINERCLCAVDGQIMCNRKGHPPENLMRGCYFPVDCEPGEMCVSEEPEPPPPPPPECTADDLSKCAGPLDKRCGVATCTDGVCGVEITPGPIASQRAGDCTMAICTFDGNVVEEYDPSDYYDDGAECTFDMCIDGAPGAVELLRMVCPDTGEGFCSEGQCVQCIEKDDCDSNEDCDFNRCVPETCANNQVDGDETDEDCGGSCFPCASEKTCMDDSDCTSNVCVSNTCQAPSCEDNEQNDGETDTDCGAACKDPAKLCGDGKGCVTSADCQSSVCWAGKCLAPTCTDGIQNGDEAGVDCGGSTCSEC